MGAHLYRRTRCRHTTTDAKITFEADISSWGRQFNTAFHFRSARVAGAGCACPVKRHRQSSRGTLTIVGLLQNWGIYRRLGKERV